MSDTSRGEGWWIASDGKWYAPELHPDAIANAQTTANTTAGVPLIEPVDSPSTRTTAEWVAPAFPAASGQPMASAPQTQEVVPPTEPYLPTAEAPATALPTPPPSKSRSRRPLVLGLVAAVLLIGLGFLLWRVFGATSAGGAASPEAAVEQLITSIAEGDAVGLVDVFDPDEIEAWFGSFAPAIEVASDAQTNDSAANDSQQQFDEFRDELLGAFDIEVTGLDGEPFVFESDTLDDDGRIATVRTQGIAVTLRAERTGATTPILGPPDEAIGIDLDAIDGAGFELRDRAAGLQVEAWAPDQEPVAEFIDGFHLDLVTVEKDGGWFVSIGYSLIEAIRNSGEVSMADPDFGRAYQLVDDQAIGAESPEEAVRQLMRALERLDYDAMIDLTDPLALPWLHDYQPAIDANVNPREISDVARELDLRVSTLELSTGAWNDRTLVEVGRLGGRFADGTFEIDTTTWCAEATAPDGERIEGCAEDAAIEILDNAGVDDTDPRDLIPDSLGFVVVERNGRWFFDPLGTMGRAAEQVASAAGELNVSDAVNEGASFAVGGLEGFLVQQGPIAAAGETVTTAAENRFAAVAIDLSGLEQPIVDSVDVPRIGLARIESDGSGLVPGIEPTRADAVEWVVVYSWGDDPVLPTVVLETDSSITVSVEPIEVIEIGSGNYFDQLDDEGRPVVVVFDSDYSYDFLGYETSYEAVSSWEGYGVVHRNGYWSSDVGDPSFGDLAVITGSPGATFDIEAYDPFVADEPEPAPDPVPEPLGQFLDERVERFADQVAGWGFDELAFRQSGGWFDGCGPDNPQASTVAFEDGTGELILVTTYIDPQTAAQAFDDLAAMQSPCDGFPGLVIEEITERSDTELLITMSTDGDSTPFYEYYSLRGETIVVATGSVLRDIDDYAVFALEGYEG